MEPSIQKKGSQDVAGKETVVGFDDDARSLLEKLMGGKKQLQIISIVGMAGLGKTTLVKKVFNEPSIVYHFHVRAWTIVTQEPKKSDLLLGILKSGFGAEIKDCSDMELSVNLKQRLSGQRYLVVLDDMWDSKEWNDLMLCFPDDNVGSRIVITSRLADLPLHVHYQHPLRFLSEKESWDLLRYKVFLKESCPSSLIEIGVHIVRKCQGLPLLIVVIAGILASDTTLRWWSQVANDMRSIASNAPEEYMETLVLSYHHLPNHLKPCFLYFAAFPEDYEIPAWKLILLWVAEGFIKIQTAETNLEEKGKYLEDIAASYLNDLISRSLVIISKRGSNGGIKACIVHDALRELCIKKADEVDFLHQMPTREHFVSESETRTSLAQRLHSHEVDEENFIRQLIRYFHLETPFPPMNELNHESSLEDRLAYKELSGPNMSPSTLKKLTLVCTFLKWDEMQKIGMLPNLEVLKLQFEAFRGEHWETSDGGFPRLKHLAFKFIKIVRWSAYSEQFPNLQHLKLEGCHQLEEIPISIGDIYTLEMIEIRNCNQAVVQSAHEIKEDQLNKGNDTLKISIFQA
ncbi:putative late blight resistance protein homolog R1A-10 [Apium graveolens]|uniref:putative late blight resistance protein homolog R1A-10 n=1 Tax=Apium graveolens TaxID=4045 RepID=UPI003D7A6EBE